eukprot:TRINITY_DN3704_c0_g1_i1.p1 TRINITY_DN3704_c0_g1~~TRINITY_DN3704_c0_g1_i1.p1  ORF type:complete len:470 (-),score=77.44 TRINITY_DN3704_c0_g1_i1:1668-2867(-)
MKEPTGFFSYAKLLSDYSASSIKDFSKVDLKGDDVACLFYTSGTTGAAKGVMLTHRNIVANSQNMITSFPEGSGKDLVYLHACPSFHLADGPTSLRITWLGGTHVILDAFKPESVLQLIAKEKVSTVVMIPTMINLCINHPNASQYDTSSLTHLIFGGSPMASETFASAMTYFSSAALIQIYGLTETAPLVTYLPFECVKSGKNPNKLLSCGIPARGVEVRVVDDEGNEIPHGSDKIGEIVCRGDNVMLGYWKRPEVTAETIKNGWLHSGDLATVDGEGFFYIVDRKKDMIITGGENVFSIEIEDILYRHPAILEAAVVGAPDPKWGEIVVALVHLRDGHTVSDKGLIKHCHEHLANFKCPKKVVFYPDPLIKGGTGKILKRKLREQFWQGEARQVHGS